MANKQDRKKSIKARFRPIALALLNDDEGICQAGYDAIYGFLDQDIRDVVDATDGRFYISEEAFRKLSKV